MHLSLETAKLIRKSVPVCEFVFGDRDARRSSPWRPFGSDDLELNLVPNGLGYFNASKVHDCAFWKTLYPHVLTQ